MKIVLFILLSTINLGFLHSTEWVDIDYTSVWSKEDSEKTPFMQVERWFGNGSRVVILSDDTIRNGKVQTKSNVILVTPTDSGWMFQSEENPFWQSYKPQVSLIFFSPENASRQVVALGHLELASDEVVEKYFRVKDQTQIKRLEEYVFVPDEVTFKVVFPAANPNFEVAEMVIYEKEGLGWKRSNGNVNIKAS